jgi:hypothetical protein
MRSVLQEGHVLRGSRAGVAACGSLSRRAISLSRSHHTDRVSGAEALEAT